MVQVEDSQTQTGALGKLGGCQVSGSWQGRRQAWLIQIDGLSRPQMEEALAHGRLPFLKRLIERHGYRIYSQYSGIPSSTPADG
jgi:hypothetical protein